MKAQIIEKIEKAIRTKTQLIITVLEPDDSTSCEIDFQPYIYGRDSYGYLFMWGYEPFRNVYYKHFIEKIVTVKNDLVTYDIRNGASHPYCTEEEHYAFLEGFNKR